MLALLWCARARSIWHASCPLMGRLPLLALLAAREGLLPAAWRLAWRVAAIRPPILSIVRWLAIVGAIRLGRRLLARYDWGDVWPEEAAWRWPVRSRSRAG